MAFKMKISLALLLVAVLFISATLALSSHRQDPELETCMHQCKQQRQSSEQEKQECEQECKQYAKEKERREGGGSGNAGQQEQQERQNPYHFRAEKFRSQIQSEQGRIGVLPRFSKRSNLLRGIDDYRFAYSEMNPQTFSVPQHWDADTICFVVQGKGAITIIEENNKQTHNLETGDIIRVGAGCTVYVVNKDNNQKLRVVKLIQPVFNPGKFKSFFSAGGRNPESFFNAFSNNILQAAFNTQSQKIQKLFQSQTRGPFLKASREQIQALSRSSSSHELPWPLPPFQEHSQGSFNLFNKRPTHSNDYGAYYEVDQDDYKQLRELDVAVGYANITRGAMLGPYYNSRATSIAVVVDGTGYTEMACPHMSSRQGEEEEEEEGSQGGRPGSQGSRQGGRQGEQGGSGEEEGGERGGSGSSSRYYKKVSARLRKGDLFIIPAGHPVVTVASQNQELQVMSFQINAQNNRKNPLAGRNNILRQLDREAKELSFNMPARQVDEVLQKQDQSWFFPGPQQSQEEEQGSGSYMM